MVDINLDAPFRVRVNRTGRRTYSREYKREIIEECSVPGASVAGVALSHRINANVVRKWLRQAEGATLGARVRMVPVVVAPAAAVSASAGSDSSVRQANERAAGVIDIQFERVHVRVRGSVDDRALRTIVETLAAR
jgi:transposase-like protein